MQGPIIAATDLAESGKTSVDLAIALAKALELPLELVHITVDEHPAIGTDPTYNLPAQTVETLRVYEERLQKIHAKAEALLREEQKRCESLGVTCRVRTLSGRAWQAIVDRAREINAPAIVTGAHGNPPREFVYGELRGRLLGSTADRVVRHAPCPVLVSSPHAAPDSLAASRWAIAVDFSTPSRAAFAQAAAWARRARASLIAVHVMPERGPIIDGVDPDTGYTEEAEAGRAQLAALVSEFAGDLDPKVETKMVQGRVADELVKVATEENASMLVVGTHGRKGLPHLFLGSVAETCLRCSSVPVLVVR